MKLSYILEMLAAAELSNLHLVDNEQFIIRPEKMPIVIRCINSGLNDIHTRFLLRKNIIDVPIIAGEDTCLLYTSPSPRDKRQSRMPSSA